MCKQKTTEEEEERKLIELIYKALGDTMKNHNLAFLNTFRLVMTDIFGPNADKRFEETVGPRDGHVYFNKPNRSGIFAGGEEAPEAKEGGKEISEKIITHGEAAFGTSGEIPSSALKVSPAINRLQKSMFGDIS